MLQTAQATAKLMSQSVAPVFLISSVAVVVSIMSVRYGRVIDRARYLLTMLDSYQKNDRKRTGYVRELRAVYQRARILRFTIILGSASIFFVILTIFFLFSHMILNISIPHAPEYCFLVSLVCLIISLLLFIEDFAISLSQLKIDIKHSLREEELSALDLQAINSWDKGTHS